MGAEALLRWTGSEIGPEGPADFIPIAEATGLIRPLDHRVIALAAEQIAILAKAGIVVPISVNVSAVSMQTEDFANEVIRCLDGCVTPRVPEHGYETARCAGYAAILTPLAASGSRAFCMALI